MIFYAAVGAIGAAPQIVRLAEAATPPRHRPGDPMPSRRMRNDGDGLGDPQSATTSRRKRLCASLLTDAVRWPPGSGSDSVTPSVVQPRRSVLVSTL
jgi:hypothetical protein